MRRSVTIGMLSAAVLAALTAKVPPAALAGEADVLAVTVRPEEGGTFRFDVTVHHEDEGWEHYADGWEVLGPDGTVLGKRPLHHPHVEQNTFTRWQPRIEIPPGVKQVTVRAHDKVHGYGGKEQVVQIPRGEASANEDATTEPDETPRAR